MFKDQWATTFGEGESLDPAIPARDFDALTEAAASVKTYVDKNLARRQDR